MARTRGWAAAARVRRHTAAYYERAVADFEVREAELLRKNMTYERRAAKQKGAAKDYETLWHILLGESPCLDGRGASAAPCAGSAATMATAMPVAMAAATAASWLAMDLSRSLPSRLSLTPMASSRAPAK